MKKLSLLIALGIVCSMAIAKPTVNVSQFETYSQQMQEMSAKYITEKKFENASKVIASWMNSYNVLSDKEKVSYNAIYSTIMYNHACALTQTNEMYQALKSLKEAVKAGFNNKEQAQNDPNLSALKSYDEFKKILKSIKA